MKYLYIMRHGDAEAMSSTGVDYDRALSNLGRSQVRNIAQQLIRMSISFQAILHSSARRTTETAQELVDQIKDRNIYLIPKKEIYHSDIAGLLNIIIQSGGDFEHLLVVGHNPTVSQFSMEATAAAVQAFPTAGIIGLQFNCNTWNSITLDQTAEMLWFLKPMNFE